MSWLTGGKKRDARAGLAVPDESSESSASLDVSSFIEPIDTSKLHPLAGLNKGLEYLSLEDEQLTTMAGGGGIIPIKDWTDDLCYGTGAVYLLGLGFGGGYGLVEGLRKADGPSRLKLNTVLNHITRRGPFVGNTAGVLTLGYNLINSSIGYFRGKHDYKNSLAAGALTGVFFRATRGPRQMALASGVMVFAAGAWQAMKAVL